jgi:hypothetical protein
MHTANCHCQLQLFQPILERTGSSTDPTAETASTEASEVQAKQVCKRDAEYRRTRESINRDRQGWDIFRKAHPMKHETARDRRRKTADKLENMLAKRFLARQKLDYADAVWLRRAVRQLRTDRIC